ncbi:MAG: transcription antitermination factor NusB [Gammaproteobacteria bacterium]|nr:transcription antitermination factor NusB [Gammaproteobacteria bacterium]
MSNSGHWARRRSRKVAMQAVYQWQMTGMDLQPLEQEYRHAGALKKADEEYFSELLHGVLHHVDELDGLLAPVLDRAVDDLDRVELALLRLGVFELSRCIDVPYRVVIDEYVELAKNYGAEESFKYVNGVLDRLALSLRETERASR